MDYLIYIAVLPVFLLLMYIYKKDTHKEPTNMLVKTFLFGVLIVIPAIIFELILDDFFPTEHYITIYRLFINVFIGVALVEETLKWLIIKVLIYKDKDFDETFDGIVYAVFASLGFACIENIFYVLANGLGTGIIRAVTAVPLHACTGIIMGYYIGKSKLYSKNNNKSQETTNILLSLIIPTTIHAIYDFLLFTKEIQFVIIWAIFTIVIYIICLIIVKKTTKDNQTTIMQIESDNSHNENSKLNRENVSYIKGTYCRNCGNNINGSNYCPNCGTKNE